MEINDDKGIVLTKFVRVNAVSSFLTVYLTREKGLVQEELGLLQYHI